MLYKVKNLSCDMVLPDFFGNAPQRIKRGESATVSTVEYQRLASIYGNAVRGEMDKSVRITEPAPIQESAPVKKKRRGKSVRG